jgi:hypothetical protein
LDALNFNLPPRQPQFAYGCCFWETRDLNKLLKLDMEMIEFSTVEIPTDHNRQSIAILWAVEAGDANLGIFSLIYDFF